MPGSFGVSVSAAATANLKSEAIKSGKAVAAQVNALPHAATPAVSADTLPGHVPAASSAGAAHAAKAAKVSPKATISQAPAVPPRVGFTQPMDGVFNPLPAPLKGNSSSAGFSGASLAAPPRVGAQPPDYFDVSHAPAKGSGGGLSGGSSGTNGNASLNQTLQQTLHEEQLAEYGAIGGAPEASNPPSSTTQSQFEQAVKEWEKEISS